MKPLSFLQRPFPWQNEPIQSLKMALGFGAFVFAFLLFFQPFGLANLKSHITWVTAVFGLICSAVMLALNFSLPILFKTFYNEENWTVGKNIFHALLIILAISIGNFAWAVHLGFHGFSFTTLIQFMAYTLVIGAFPVSISTLLAQNRLAKKYGKASDEINAEHKSKTETDAHYLELVDEEKRNTMSIRASELCYIKSADNYVEIHQMKNGEPSKSLLRNSLKNVEEQLSDSGAFYRCHRSYIINLNWVKKVEGNARGLRLHLDEKLPFVPVARSKNAAISSLLSS